MDNSSLIAAFKEATKSGWSLQSDVQVLNWLEDFMERLQKRANNVTEEMHKLLEQTEAVEQDLYNTFNSFRGLSNTQFIENCVCEGDEMTVLNSDSTIQLSEVCVPTQRYEEDIVPRYKEALLSGLNGYKQYIQRSYRNTSEAIPHKVGWSNGQLPHIIGTEEFMRDNSCGLTEDRIFGMDPLELDADAEGEGICLASEMAGTRSLLEADWSGTESDKDDQVGMEPAVSAALDFKAMLEAALRSPYIPYDDILSNSKIISGYDNNIGIDAAASQVSGVPNSQSIVGNEETSVTPIHASITSKSMEATAHQVVSSSFNRKLHPDTVAGGLFDSEAALSTSIINEYLSLHSQPADGSHNVKGGSFNEKAKLKSSTHPEEINSFVEGQQDPCQSGSNYISSKVNITEISQALLDNKGVSTSSRLHESTPVLSLPTPQISKQTIDSEKMNSRSIGSKREGIASQEPGKDLFGSSNFIRKFEGALFSGGLFDDEDELVSSSPLESTHVWSQPSVPERLYGSNSNENKNELSPSSSISSTLDRTASNSSDKLITTDTQVSTESRSQFSGTEQLEKTLDLNNEFATGAPQFPKANNSRQSLKERLSLLQKGLFDSGENDEDDDPSDPFRAPSSMGLKLRLNDRALDSESNILQESNDGVEFNIPSTILTDSSDPHKVEQLHSTGASGRIQGTLTIGDYHSNISGVKETGVEGSRFNSDDSKKFGTPVNLTVKDELDPKKGPFSSPVTPFHKEDLLNHFLTAVPRKDHSDDDSDSWSSSSSEKTIKSSMLDVKSNTINSSSCENIVLEAKGISDPAGDSTSVLQEEGSVNSTQDGLLLEPTYGGTEYFSKKQEYSGKDDSSLPVSLAEFETLPIDQHVDVRRVEASMILNQPIEFLNTSVLHENQNKGIQRLEDKADVDAAHSRQLSSSSSMERNLEGSDLTFVSGGASLFKNEEFVTASAESVAIDAPKKTDPLWSSDDQLKDSSQYVLAELDDETKDGQTVLANRVQLSEGTPGNFTKNIQKEPNSMSSFSVAPKEVEKEILLSPSDTSQPEGFPKTSLSSPLEETKVPSIYSQLFDDEDEEETNLFGALPNTNPVIASLLKTPGKRLSLFDSDEE